MVRTVFTFCVGFFPALMLSHTIFAQNIELLVARLGMDSHKSVQCPAPIMAKLVFSSSGNRFSQCAKFFDTSTPERFKFSQTEERFSLKKIRAISFLNQQGGSRLFQVANTIPLFSNALSAGIEMKYRDPFLSVNSTPLLTTQLNTQVVLKGSMKRMTYRAVYSYASQNSQKALSINPNNHAGGKLLWEWKLPFVTPKVELSRFTNNVDRNPTHHQTVSTRQQYSLDWTIPNFPSVTLGYGRENKNIISPSEGSRAATTLQETVITKVAFKRPRGKGEWASQFSSSHNDVQNQGTIEELRSNLKGTLNLNTLFTISPRIGFTRKNNAKQNFAQIRRFANLETIVRLSTEQTIQPGFEWNRINNRGQDPISNRLLSKLQYSYKPSNEGYQISIMGQYIFNQTSQQIHNTQTYDMSVFIKKDLHEILDLPHQQQTVSLKLTHNQQVNSLSTQIQPSHSTATVLLSMIP